MGMTRRLVFALVGAVVVVTAFPLAAYLAAEYWSPGAVGFWLVLAFPGLAALAHATQVMGPVRLAPLFPVGVGLLGFDVTDSARPGVVTAGYVLTVLSAVAALTAAMALNRRAGAAV